MDDRKIAEYLKMTIDPNQRDAAEKYLKEIEKIIGVAPSLLKIVMSNEIEMPVRQAGSIYLKNMINMNWEESGEGEQPRFHIHEQDRATVRDSLVEAAVRAPPPIKSQLCVCIGIVAKSDFPSRWSSLVDSICSYLQNPEIEGWNGALSALLALVKCYEYTKNEERKPLNEAMNLLLPLVQNVMGQVVGNLTKKAMGLQRLVLKIFYALTQHHLSLNLLTQEKFGQWMEVVHIILDRDHPDYNKKIDEEEREELEQEEWWKTKKWAMRILYRMFERYGSPGSTTKEYHAFATWFLNTFSCGALNVIFKIMDSYRQGIFVASKVLRDALLYLKNAVNHAYSWKYVKPHTGILLTDIIYPMMCHSDEDDRLWNDDPVEYIRVKYADSMEEESYVACGELLLNSMCKKRKGVLPKCLQIVDGVLNEPTSSARQRDGALHMIGAISDLLLKKEMYREQFDDVLLRFVFPSFATPYPFLRARSAWLLSKLSLLKFAREDILNEVMRVLVGSILNKEEEMPVKVEAAFAIEEFVSNQSRSHAYIQSQIRDVSVEILQILRETENDELTNVLQKLVCTFVNEISSIAHDICLHLALTFQQIMEGAGDVDGEKTIVSMGLLNTMETLLVVMEEQPEACLALEPILLQVVTFILDKSIMEFYEEAFSLISSLIEKQVSPAMWSVFEGTYRIIERDGVEYFIEMMPCLHNYITVDTDAFLSDPNRLLAICNIVKQVLLDCSDPVEDLGSHAAKLIEVLILQCGTRIQSTLPGLLQLVLERLRRPIKTSELRTMCLQVVVAALYVDVQLTASVIPNMDLFVKQLLNDTDCFLGLHDRKICVLGLCSLLQLQNPLSGLDECSKKILPSMILLFDGLKRAYAAKALENADSESEEEDETDEDTRAIGVEVLDTDEDDIDEEGEDYLENLQHKVNSQGSNAPFPMTASIVSDTDDDDEDDDDDDSDYSGEETPLECYTTPLDEDESTVDEYIIFKEVMINLERHNPNFYSNLTNILNEEQKKSVVEIFTLADQRRAAAESKEIQKRGGYEFVQQAVPTTFNFGTGGAPAFH